MFSPMLRYALLIALLLVSYSATRAATFSVNTNGDTQDVSAGNGVCADSNGQCSLRAAITEANALAGDDIINLPSGSYTQTLVAATENLNAGGDWDIRSNITINGTGSGTTILQAAATAGAATERVLDFVSGSSTLNKVTVRYGRFTGSDLGGSNTAGAGMRNQGTLTLNFVVVRDNLQNADGAGGTMSGGIHNAGPSITVNDSTVTANQCNNSLSNCRGGGMYSSAAGAHVTIARSTFSSNSASYTGAFSGGGIGAGFGATSSDNTVVISDSSFTNNSARGSTSSGIGFEISFPTGTWTVNVTNSKFSNNQALSPTSGAGAGVYVTGYLSAIDLTFDRVAIDGNSSNSTGGGMVILADRGAVTGSVRNSSITNNSSANVGGGMLIANQSTALESTITVNLLNTTVSGNSSKSSGGGLHAFRSGAGNPATINLDFCTFTNNTADSDNDGTGDGGGISANVASNEATISLKNSIVANNTDMGGQAPDIFRTMITGGYNHIKNTTGGIFVAGSGDTTGTDPTLTALALNGGVTLNRLPDAGSPVKDTIPMGTNGCGNVTATDQRGVVRPSGGSCDKGATERGLIIVTNEVLPYGSINDTYGTPIVADFGTPTYTYTVVGGTLPAGLTLNTDGTWSGIATETKLYSFTVQATDSATFVRGSGRNASRAVAANTTQKTFQLRILGPTSSDVSISGRVLDSAGRGIRNVNVYLTDQQGRVYSVTTGSFGYYQFAGIATGQICVVSVAAKRFNFSEPARVMSVNNDTTGVDFVANE